MFIPAQHNSSNANAIQIYVFLVQLQRLQREQFAPRKNPLISIECNKVVDNRFISVLLRYIFLLAFFFACDRDTFLWAPCCRCSFRAAIYLLLSLFACNRKEHFSLVNLMHIRRSSLHSIFLYVHRSGLDHE